MPGPTPTTQAAPEQASDAVRPSGTITGVNHLVLVCKDMEATLQFYCGILGLKVWATREISAAAAPGSTSAPRRFYWLKLTNGDTLALLEVPDERTAAEPSFFPTFWPGSEAAPAIPRKMDHLALNVESLDDLKAVRQRLLDGGWPVSEVFEESKRWPHVSSIYLYDPNHLPLEIATFDFGDPAWESRTDADLLVDPNPPPFFRR